MILRLFFVEFGFDVLWLHYFTLQESFSILSFRGSEKSAMDGFKKQKMVNLVWRPISTHSSSILAG